MEKCKQTNNITPPWLHFANFKKAIQIELPRGKMLHEKVPAHNIENECNMKGKRVWLLDIDGPGYPDIVIAHCMHSRVLVGRDDRFRGEVPVLAYSGKTNATGSFVY